MDISVLRTLQRYVARWPASMAQGVARAAAMRFRTPRPGWSFLPGCSDSKILEASHDVMKASLLVAKAGIKQWFTTHNVLEPGKRIDMQLVDGPFRSLNGGWTFSALSEDACKIELNLEFEFSNKLAEMAFGKIFNSLASNMVQAFTERARSVYA